jgi:hypothetical protein
MSDDAVAAVLRLVAEGRLTAAEAGPILDALDGDVRNATVAHLPDPADGAAAPPASGPGRAIRVEVTEAGRQVVNLRVPLSLGRSALARVPGLSVAMTDRIREAIENGVTGPILATDEGSGDGVRIVIE